MEGFDLDLFISDDGTFFSTRKVYRKKDKKVFCLKISKEVLEEENRQLIENEFLLMKNLKHPNIIKYISSYWDDNKFYILTEFVDGGNLKSKITQKLSEQEILKILVQILEGLNCLHSHNIVHQNLKPENILFTKSGQIKITNFRYAKVIEKSVLPPLSSVDNSIFIAPEINLNQPYGTASDIWSIGVIAYLLATQILPLNGSTQKEMIEGQIVLKTDFIHLEGQFSSNFKYIVNKMLIKLPGLRPAAQQLLFTIKGQFPILQTKNQFLSAQIPKYSRQIEKKFSSNPPPNRIEVNSKSSNEIESNSHSPIQIEKNSESSAKFQNLKYARNWMHLLRILIQSMLEIDFERRPTTAQCLTLPCLLNIATIPIPDFNLAETQPEQGRERLEFGEIHDLL